MQTVIITPNFVLISLAIILFNIVINGQELQNQAIIQLEVSNIVNLKSVEDMDNMYTGSTYEIGFNDSKAKCEMKFYNNLITATLFNDLLLHETHMSIETMGIITTIKTQEKSDENQSGGLQIEVTDEFKVIDKYFCQKIVFTDYVGSQTGKIEVYVSDELVVPFFAIPMIKEYLPNIGVPLELTLVIDDLMKVEYRLKSITYTIPEGYFDIPESTILPDNGFDDSILEKKY